MPDSTCPTRPATRTMKNSSRLFAEIERKRSRSSSGWIGLLDSSSTRRLNSSHESSRLMNRSGDAIKPIEEASAMGGAVSTGLKLRLAARLAKSTSSRISRARISNYAAL